MKRALVTGASGFVGANLARRLAGDGHQVHLLLRPDSQTWRLHGLDKSLRIHRLCLEDREAVSRVVREIKPEWIFHLAVSGAYSWQADPFQMIQSNVVGTMSLLDACLSAGFESFVNTGSSSEYGFKDHAPSETEVLEPNSYYSVTKACATHFCQYIARKHGLNVPTLRLYSVYGPYEEPRRLFPTLAVRGLAGRLPVLVDRSIARDYVYIDEAVEAYLLAATKPTDDPGAVYNVGTGIQTTIEQLVNIACQLLDIEDTPDWGSMPNRAWDSTNWVADNRKLIEKLGWESKVPVTDGFLQLVEWLRSNDLMHKIYKESVDGANASPAPAASSVVAS